MPSAAITVKTITDDFKKTIRDLQEEPDFQWSRERVNYALGENGEPAVKVAIGNVPLDYDLWQGLRNPAVAGLFSAGLREIWEFYANRRKREIDESGRQTIFQISRSFDYARSNYSRAVIISVMLPLSQKVLNDYVQLFLERGKMSSHLYSRMMEDANQMIDRATSRVGIDLVGDDNVVVPMDEETVKRVSMEAVPITHQGASNGPSLEVNYSQKSVGVLMGLGQFGVGRIVMRDEFVDGRVQRFIGPIRSIIIFDKEELVEDGTGGVVYPSEEWRLFLFKLFDFTSVDPEINKYRFCGYIPYGDEGCMKCVDRCPSGALPNSVPSPDGTYPDEVSRQAHRFWEGKLRFDFGRCCEERGQMGTLFSEWSCSRCVSICGTQGNRRVYAAKNYYEKMLDSTRGQLQLSNV